MVFFSFQYSLFFSVNKTCFKTAAARDIERASVLQSCSRVQGPPRPAPSSAPWQVRCPCVMYSGIMSRNNRIFIYISMYIHLYLYHIYMLIELVQLSVTRIHSTRTTEEKKSRQNVIGNHTFVLVFSLCKLIQRTLIITCDLVYLSSI